MGIISQLLNFVLPWMQTFPHPLSRLKAHPHDKHQKAVRNWMSYSVVNDFTYTGLSMMFNRFRKKLHLAPIRTGNNGADILTEHKVTELTSYFTSEVCFQTTLLTWPAS